MKQFQQMPSSISLQQSSIQCKTQMPTSVLINKQNMGNNLSGNININIDKLFNDSDHQDMYRLWGNIRIQDHQQNQSNNQENINMNQARLMQFRESSQNFCKNDKFRKEKENDRESRFSQLKINGNLQDNSQEFSQSMEEYEQQQQQNKTYQQETKAQELLQKTTKKQNIYLETPKKIKQTLIKKVKSPIPPSKQKLKIKQYKKTSQKSNHTSKLCLTMPSDTTTNIKIQSVGKSINSQLISPKYDNNNIINIFKQNKNIRQSNLGDSNMEKNKANVDYKQLFIRQIKKNQKLKTQLNQTKVQNDKLKQYLSNIYDVTQKNMKKRKDNKQNERQNLINASKNRMSGSKVISKYKSKQKDRYSSIVQQMKQQVKTLSNGLYKINKNLNKLQTENKNKETSNNSKLKKMIKIQTQIKDTI